jgi:hypothetical protein
VSDTIPEQGAARARASGGRPAVAALVLVLAVGLFAAAFWYVGGVDYVTGILGGGPGGTGGTPSGPAPGASASATTTPAGDQRPTDVPDAHAKRMYIEQIESEPQISRLQSGKTTGFTIDEVQEKSPNEKWVAITASFSTSPKTVKGVMAFSKAGSKWYFLWIQDLTGAAKTAAGLFTTPRLTEPEEPTSEEYEEAGITTVDQAVVDTILTSQAANQEFVAGILEGKYTAIALEKPVEGPGTLVIPVTATGATGEEKGSVTLIIKRIDGKDRTFVASFKKQ